MKRDTKTLLNHAGISINGFQQRSAAKPDVKPVQSRQPSYWVVAGLLLGVSLVVFIAHFLFYRHSFPPINVDEASFFSPATSFAANRNLASDVHKSFLPGAATYTYWMPPLYIVLLGSFLKLFGSTVFTAKVFSLLLSGASAVLFAWMANDRYGKIAAAALFLICPFILVTSAFIRVEALAIFLTVLAIVAVRKGWSAALLGTLAALGIMTHPLMLACAAGLGFTALRKGVRPLLFFLLAFAVVLSPYLWYILQDVALFKAQMHLQLLRKAKASFFDLKPAYLLQSVPMVLLALWCLYKVKTENALRLFLTVSMLLALVIVLRSNEFNYQVYLVPYVLASVVLVLEKAQPVYRWAVPLVLYGFFGAVLFSKMRKYRFRTDADFNQLVDHLQQTPLWKGKAVFAAGGPDVSTYLMMQGVDVERQVPVPQTLPPNWFDKYNHVVEVRENGAADEGVFEEKDKPHPWRSWQAETYTTTDGAYTLTQYMR